MSTRYGQWCRQRQWREDRDAAGEGRPPVPVARYRLHDLRHAFAIASLIDDPTCIYRLMEQVGQSSVKTTEIYTRFLRGEGAQRRYAVRITPASDWPRLAAGQIGVTSIQAE